MRYYHKNQNEFQEIDLVENGEALEISLNGKTFRVNIKNLDAGRFSVIVDNIPHSIHAQNGENGLELVHHHIPYQVNILNQRQKMESELFGSEENAGAAGDIRAPMPGKILRIEVAPGQTVAAGDPLIIIEAMKMENEIKAAAAGTISEILVSEQQPVERNDLLISITAGDDS